jgi:uncharacterized membrane protein
MNWHNELFTIPAITGLVFAIMGCLFYSNPPKEINGYMGYRTGSSMKNQAQWDFSQKYSSKIMLYLGLGLIAFSTLGLFTKFEQNINDLLIFVSIILTILLLIVFTERAIKKKFKH